MTGSIAMGKSTAAEIFRRHGVPVYDADAQVHQLYAVDGAAVPLIAELLPRAVVEGAVDRAILKQAIAEDGTLLSEIEAVVHPLLAQSRHAFVEAARDTGAAFAVFDIPLLFETGAEADFDKIVVVSAPAPVQRARALARPGMTEDQLTYIMSRQIPDAVKRRKADFIIDTSGDLEDTADQIRSVIEKLTSMQG
ncbi:MAG: dephospho-CoA kinase [Neomegalonema sp.]|nr:dephospho-CoA kinase [Neomegalonema sp.]